jgi:hypothetical protein
MPNSNRPFGLRPVGSMNGAPWNNKVQKYAVLAADTTAIFIGDTVALAASNTLTQTPFKDHPVPIATKAATSDVTIGVCVGVEPLPGDLGVNYRKASTLMGILVCTDPNTVYEIQGDVDTFDAADVGLNASITVSTGSTTTGISNAVLDQSTVDTTTTLAVQILGMQAGVDNDISATATYPTFLVRLNNHQFVEATTGIS